MRYWIISLLGLIIAALDQLTKAMILDRFFEHETLEVTPFFNFVLVRNRGAAFGFLNDPESTWQTWFFMGAAILAVLVILLVARAARAHEKGLFVALGCILGGAVGNLIDRARFGSVVDFLDFHYAGWHWPAFNVADSFICIGAVLAALLLLRPQPREE